jgi:hypothetical protein
MGCAPVWRGRTSGGGRGIIRAFAAGPEFVEQKRVQFDFKIAFSNGGGLEGRDFRLDIDGDDISDEALADYLVRDLRLLMVGSVQVSNKKIITEPHKRVS